MCVPTTRFLLSTMQKRGQARMKLYKGRTKDVLALCTKRDFYTASFPPHRKHMAWRFFRLSGFGACFFVFHGGGLPCSSRGRQSCRRVASARAAETRGEREAPGTAPREDPLARAIASRLRAPASRLRAQASNTHTQQRRGAELRTPRRERNEKREKILLLLLKRTTVVFLAFLSRSPFVWSPGV